MKKLIAYKYYKKNEGQATFLKYPAMRQEWLCQAQVAASRNY